jgi:Superfamily I DNA and RNA helicases
MLKVRDLVKKESCPYRGFLDGQNLGGSKGKEYYTAIALKKLLEQLTIQDMTDEKAVRGIFYKYLAREIFISKSEMKKDINLFVDQIVRYANWELAKCRKVLRKLASHTLQIEGEFLKVDADLIVENQDGSIELIKFRRKKPEMTMKGRKRDTDPKQSMELYLMQVAGEALYPDKVIIPTIIYLANTSDKDGLSEFEEEKGKVKKGKNVISYHFGGNDIHSTEVNVRVENVIREKSENSSKKCTGTDCDRCQYSNLCLYTHVDNSKLEVVPQIEKAKKVQWTYPQRQFIRFTEGYCRLNAVAGAGKTSVNAKRVIELIKNHFYSPKDFLLITFTEKGVRELKEKMAYWIKVEKLDIDINDITIMTFNGFGYELIKKEYSVLGFTEEPQILDKLDKYDIIANILDEEEEIEGLNYRYPLLDFFSAKGAIVETAEVVQIIKDGGYTYPDEMIEALGMKEEYAYRMFGVYLKFQKQLKEQNFVEYQDQIDMCIELLSNPDMVEKYGYKHIVIDEFQDTNMSQMYIIQQLVQYSKFVSLIVCGDDTQAIFSWRGGNQDNILNFHLIFPETKDYFLKNNFRSTKQISRLANQLNDINTKKIKKEIISDRDGEAPVMRNVNTLGIVQFIKDKIEAGIPMYEIGVIARTKAELLEVEKALKTEGVPCLLAVTELLKDNNKVKNIIGFSNFLVDNTLDLHFAEWLQVSNYEEFSNVDDLRIFIATEKNKFLEAYEALDGPGRVNMFYTLLEPIAQQDRAVERLLNICKRKGFITPKEVSEFLVKIKKYDSELAIEKDDSVYNSVVLSTAHASKGREFEVVIGLMDEYRHTTKDDIASIAKTEEERRLLIVTITRAKEHLLLTYEKRNGFVDEVDNILF